MHSQQWMTVHHVSLLRWTKQWTWTSQLRTSQPSILAIQVGHMSHVLQMMNTAARLVRAHLDFCTSWDHTMIFAVLKAWLISLFHCFINCQVFFQHWFSLFRLVDYFQSIIFRRRQHYCTCLTGLTVTSPMHPVPLYADILLQATEQCLHPAQHQTNEISSVRQYGRETLGNVCRDCD